MSIDNHDVRSFLLELHSMTGGDPEQQVSMYEIGERLGMDKETITPLSQDMMIDELLELKTLSGGIGITQSGLQALQSEGLIAVSGPANTRQLSVGPVLDENDIRVVEKILADIKGTLASSGTEYSQLEELVIDIKTIETQLLSPQPKTAVVKEIFRSLQTPLQKAGHNAVAKAVGILL